MEPLLIAYIAALIIGGVAIKIHKYNRTIMAKILEGYDKIKNSKSEKEFFENSISVIKENNLDNDLLEAYEKRYKEKFGDNEEQTKRDINNKIMDQFEPVLKKLAKT